MWMCPLHLAIWNSIYFNEIKFVKDFLWWELSYGFRALLLLFIDSMVIFSFLLQCVSSSESCLDLQHTSRNKLTNKFPVTEGFMVELILNFQINFMYQFSGPGLIRDKFCSKIKYSTDFKKREVDIVLTEQY